MWGSIATFLLPSLFLAGREGTQGGHWGKRLSGPPQGWTCTPGRSQCSSGLPSACHTFQLWLQCRPSLPCSTKSRLYQARSMAHWSVDDNYQYLYTQFKGGWVRSKCNLLALKTFKLAFLDFHFHSNQLWQTILSDCDWLLLQINPQQSLSSSFSLTDCSSNISFQPVLRNALSWYLVVLGQYRNLYII